MVPTFSLAYTSRRAGSIEGVVQTWRTRAGEPDGPNGFRLEVVVSVDADYKEGIDVCTALEADKKIDKFIVNTGRSNCVSGWNTAAAGTTGDVIIALADDFSPPVGWANAFAALGGEWWKYDRTVWVSDGYNPDLMTLTVCTRTRYNRFGYLFYPEYESLFCLPAESKIWMGDYLFKPIEAIKPGDQVIGSVRKVGSRGTKGQTREFLTRTTVTRVKTKISPVVKVTLESGHVIRCTPDHCWGSYFMPNGRVGRKNGIHRHPITGQVIYAEPAINRPLMHVVNVPPPPPSGSDRDLGWLGGFYDGEGNSGIFLAQSTSKNEDLCGEYEALLTKYGFQFSLAKSRSAGYEEITGREHRHNVYTILGGKNEYVRLINWTRPVRRTRVQVDKKILTSRFGTPDRIVSIEDDGAERVYCLSTETGNYVADGYLSHNSDTEFTYVAKYDSVIIDARHLMFEHMHPDCGKRGRDPVDLNHASMERWNRGEVLFKYRHGCGFPIDVGPKAHVYDPEKKLNFALYVQAIKDDIGLFEVCARILEEGKVTPNCAVNHVYLCVPDEYWSGRKTTDAERGQVMAVVRRINDLFGPNTAYGLNLKVAPHRVQGRSRIMVETYVRNESINAIRALSGCDDILIADGDELWRRGLLNRLCEYVREHNPASVHTGMVPTVGLPGFAVDQALDKASIYISKNAFFTECRGASGFRHELAGHDVIHFTSTRPSLPEIISKSKESGHADDPAYDFDGWIKNVLPHIKRDSRNLHMFRHYQIWPRLRAWTKAEWDDIPFHLQQYLDPWISG